MYNRFGADYDINVQLTLEEHLAYLASRREEAKILYTLWELLRRDLSERLQNSRSTFIHFSLHDSTHSRTVVSAIEMFLGTERIRRLSTTDTFMLLCCAYAHDYGMALSVDKLYNLLRSDDFIAYIDQEKQKEDSENYKYIKIIYDILRYDTKAELADIYLAIIVILQDYLRPYHWQGVAEMENDFAALFGGRLKVRLVKSMVQICQLHGAHISEISKLERYAQGAGTDIYHPRFVAAMLQLGDLLDLDNNRFPSWFVNAVMQDGSTIPPLSKLHYKKHESISHYYVGPKRIQIVAHCEGEDATKIAQLLDDWLDMLDHTCDYLIKQWSSITQEDFGRPPRVTKREIYVRPTFQAAWRLYSANNRPLQMQMSQKKVLDLLKGTNIYDDRYVGIRELVQNAVDASLLQLWYDIRHNKYANLIDKNQVAQNKEISFLDIPESIFGFYDIKIELIRDLVEKKIFVVVKDKGVGITDADLEFMASIGESKERNQRIRDILETMPKWLRPSGIFGIGLQSVFQLTDEIKFYSRRPNEAELEITFYSYGKSKGRIEVQHLEEPADGMFYDNYMQGTNVKFAINCDKLFTNEEEFQYYDPEFDGDERLNAVFAEMSNVIDAKLKESPFNYFNIYFQTMTVYPSDSEHPKKQPVHRSAYCFFEPTEEEEKKKMLRKEKQHLYRRSIDPFRSSCKSWEKDFFTICNNLIYYWDSENSVFYLFQLNPCQFSSENTYLPPEEKEKRSQLRVWYKFTELTDLSEIYRNHLVGNEARLFASFLSIDIIIFDSPADRYLNIDRIRFKEDGFQTIRIEEMQHTILSKLCKEMNAVQVEQDDKLRRQYGTLRERKEYLVSLVLLFYRYADSSDWEVFVRAYPEVMEINLKVGQVTLPLREFFEEAHGVQATYGRKFPDRQMTNTHSFEESAKVVNCLIHSVNPQKMLSKDFGRVARVKDLLRILPANHLSILKIDTIFIENGNRIHARYQLALKRYCVPNSVVGIEMDEMSRLTDYYKALGFDKGYKSIDFMALQKKLFKPDREFADLLVTRKPKNFSKGKNFLNDLEANIDQFILSPFDDQTIIQLRRFVTGQDSGENGQELDRMWETMKSSVRFHKCVDYVVKYGLDPIQLDQQVENDTNSMRHYENMRENRCRAITRAYERFAKNIMVTLKKYYPQINVIYQTKDAEKQFKLLVSKQSAGEGENVPAAAETMPKT